MQSIAQILEEFLKGIDLINADCRQKELFSTIWSRELRLLYSHKKSGNELGKEQDDW